MTKTKTDSNVELTKSKSLTVLEYFLFVFCLCVITLTVTPFEGKGVGLSLSLVSSKSDIYSLSIPIFLVLSFIVWCVWNICGRNFFYRVSGIEPGVCVLFIAGMVSSLFASDKRAAISHFITILAVILMGILLVQILDSGRKRKWLLYIVILLGVVSAYWSTEQLLSVNQVTINAYEEDPQAVLGPRGIEPGSFRHMLFERLVYSRDVRGFFTTGNSSGSFLLLVFFAVIAVLSEKAGRLKSKPENRDSVLILGAVALIVLYNFVITRSKGAFVGFSAATVMFICYLCFYRWLKSHRLAVVVFVVLGSLGFGCAVVFYGLTHGCLPGGNSMLVRWQYWYASVDMYADHWITGVGPGNFSDFYPHYMAPSAPEMVSDPHNFLLSILTQYGPLGLAGFLLVFLVPLLRIIFIRPVEAVAKSSRNSATNIALAAIFVGITAVLIHNVIDFAIFEVGILMTFFALLGCLVAMDYHQRGCGMVIFKPTVFSRAVVITAAVLVVSSVFCYSWLPVYRRDTMLLKGQEAAGSGKFKLAGEFFDAAAKADRLSPTALTVNAQMNLQRFSASGSKEKQLLLKAESCILEAIRRNRADFRNHERLTGVYIQLAQIDSQNKDDWLNKAFSSGCQAVKLFGGSGRLRLTLGIISEQLGKTETALEQFEKAVDIEDSYRMQFQQMYPGEKVFSRLGEKEYNLAKQQIERLKKKLDFQ